MSKGECLIKPLGGTNMITKTINTLFKATEYGVWGISILGIFACFILAVVNFPLGILSSATFLAGLSLAIGLTFILLPEAFEFNHYLCHHRMPISIVFFIIAFVLMGGIYFMNGGFPALNLLFI